MKKLVKFPEVLFFQEGPGVRNTQYTSEGVKLLNVANLVNGQVDLSTSDRFISIHEAYGKYKHFLCDEGDFIIASSGIKVEYVDKKMGFVDGSMLPLCMNTSTIRFKVLNNKELNIRYFMYYLKSKHFKAQLGKQITGSAQLNYGPSHLKDMTLPMTDIGIQNNIVNILDKIQNIINTYETKLEKLDKLVRARFVEMFGDPLNNTKGWGEQRLGECCVINPKKNIDSRLEEDLVISFIPMASVSENGEILKLEDRFYRDVKNGFTYFCEGDVLFAKITPCMENGKGAVAVGLTNSIGFGSTEFHVLRPIKEKSNSYWLYVLTSFDFFRKKAEENMTGSAGQKRVQASFLENIKISVPPITLQAEFEQFVHQVDKSKVEVQKALDKAQLLFDSLMQKYFG